MQPEQPEQSDPVNPTPAQPGVVAPGNPYDFILKDSAKPQRHLFPGGNSKTKRIILTIIAVSVVLLLGIVLFSSLSASNSAGTTEMITAAQQQQEIGRISKLATTKARKTETKNLAITTAGTMHSDQTTLVAYLKKNGKKLSAKDLALGRSIQTDAAVTQAEQVNHFDDTLLTTLAKQISEYQATLKSAHDHTSSATGKKLLEQMYANAASLSDKLQKLTAETP